MRDLRPAPRSARAAAALAWALAIAVIGIAVAAAATSTGPVPWKLVLVPAFFAVPGLLVAAGRPSNPLGWLMLLVAACFAVSALATAWVDSGHQEGAAWAIWYADRAGAVLVPFTLLILLLLPDGHLPSRRWRAVTAAAVGLQVLLVLVWSLVNGPAAAPDSSWPVHPANPAGVLPAVWGDVLAGLDLWLLQAPLLLAFVAILVRVRRRSGDESRRLVSVLAAAVVFVLLVVVGRALWPAAAGVFDIAGSALLAAALSAAVLRRRLHGVNIVVGHAFVYTVLTAFILLGYVAVVALSGSLGRDLPPPAIGLVTAAIALLLLPLRSRLQWLLDRAMYGDGRDPRARVRQLTEELIASRQQIVTAREEERSRLRRDLHDELGPTLAGLSMQLGDMQDIVRDDVDVASARLAQLETAARQALDDVRRVSRGLRPPALDELGLVGALCELADQQGLHVDTRPARLAPLAPGVEVATYRIASEAITNVARHSGTDQLDLELDVTPEQLVVRVVDHGRGVRAAAAGVGILAMRERAEELGGSLRVRDTEGGGTTVEGCLPFAKLEASR